MTHKLLRTTKEWFTQSYISMLLKKSKPIFASGNKIPIACISKIGHSHARMYLIMIKSFLYTSQLNLPMFIVDDGTLTNDDKTLLKHHIKNLRIISRRGAERKISFLLTKYPYCLRYYLKKAPFLYTHNQTFFETILLHNHNRFIAIDADIIFFQKPSEIIRWIAKQKINTLALSFQPSYARDEIKWGRLALRALAKKWKSTIPLVFNDGILCSSKNTYALPAIEQCLKYVVYPIGIQNHWLSVIILHAALFATQYKDMKRLTFLDWKSYRIATRLNTEIHRHTDTLIATHYIADNKQYWSAAALSLLLKTRLFTMAHT